MSALPPELAQRIAEAKRRADLAAIVGRQVKLRKAGRELVGLCPFHDERTASFAVVPDKGFAHCFGCGWHGDVLGFVQAIGGVSFGEALRALEAECGIGVGGNDRPSPSPSRLREGDKRQSRKVERDAGVVGSAEAAVTVWKAGQRAAGSLIERYLAGRGIDACASRILDVVRFHPRCPVALWRRGRHPESGQTCEAMLSPICAYSAEDAAFVQQGVHITFLAPDGNGKAKLPPWQDRNTGEWINRPSRKVWGEAALGCVPVPGLDWGGDWRDGSWLSLAGALVVAEGLESTLSLALRLAQAERGIVRGALATLSLNNLQGYALLNGPKGSLPLWNPAPDPERPAFTVPDGGRVVIGVDADMKGLKQRLVQERPRGEPIKRDVAGGERTQLCADLASGFWRRAGASDVQVMRPHAGADFNDEAMGEAA